MANFSDVNSTSAGLYYKPPWYHIGAADDTLMAIAYGLIALATIMRVEDIAELLLFRDRETTTFSDLGSFVTFRNSTWVELAKWIFQRRDPRVSRRPLFGVFLRIIVTLAEVAKDVMNNRKAILAITAKELAPLTPDNSSEICFSSTIPLQMSSLSLQSAK